MGMPLDGIVKHLNKIKYLRFCLIACRVYLFLDYALFECGKEALGHRVMPKALRGADPRGSYHGDSWMAPGYWIS